MDTERREKELRNKRFAREELGELLKLFSGLGVTVTLGIVGSFLLGLWADRKLAEAGMTTYGLPRIIFLLGGLAMTVYWAYLRIARHLDKFENKTDGKGKTDSGISDEK